MLICASFVSLTACGITKNKVEQTSQAVTQATETKADKITEIEDVNTDDFDKLVKDNKSITITTDDSLGTSILAEEFYYIWLMPDDSDIYIRCSENDFNTIKELQDKQDITLVYAPIDADKYLVMQENEQILLSYK